MLQHKFSIFIFTVMIVLFCVLTANLFMVRFRIGDIYPPYSSFRSDPLGTRAFYDVMKHIGLHKVDRNFDPPKDIPDPEATCLITAGVLSGTQLRVNRQSIKDILHLSESGCRLVIALSPTRPSESARPDEQAGKASPKPAENEKKPEEPSIPPEFEKADLFKMLGITVNRTRIRQKNQYAVPSQEMRDEFNASPVKWQQSLWFEPLEPGWTAVYAVDSREPVIIEKAFKNGSIVLMADSYVLSNESLKDGNSSALLTWLVGKKPAILFNEYHLGVRKKAGVSTLLKKYQLYGPAAYALVFILLLLWKLSARLLPADKHDGGPAADEPLVSKRDTGSFSGLAGLLRQHIPEKELIHQCIDAWKNTFIKDNQSSKKYIRQYQQMKTFISEPDTAAGKPFFGKRFSKRIPENYIRICRILSERENP